VRPGSAATMRTVALRRISAVRDLVLATTGPSRDDSPYALPAQLDQWRSELAGLPELGFTRRAALLQDRPRPPKQQLDAARGASGPDRVPVWAHALLESVVTAERLVAHFQARAAADLAELAGSYPGLREHLATEIALALGCSEGTASRRLDEAEETASRLPATVSGRWRGVLSTAKVTALRAETENLSDVVAAQVEADVLGAAPRQTVPELRAAIRESILRRDPDGADLRHRSAVARRRLSRWALPDGMAALQVVSSATDIAAVHDCISVAADLAKTPNDTRAGDRRSTPRRRAGGHMHRSSGIRAVRGTRSSAPTSATAAGAGHHAAGRAARFELTVHAARTWTDHR
jgi:hypothetical protein